MKRESRTHLSIVFAAWLADTVRSNILAVISAATGRKCARRSIHTRIKIIS